MASELKMPELGQAVTGGTIGKWLKQPGDKVNKYDLLVEVQTDKVNTEIPSPVAGTLKEVKVEEGQTVPIGTLLATFETADGDVAAASPAASPQVAPSRPQPTPPQANDAAAPAPSSSAASMSQPRPPSSASAASPPSAASAPSVSSSAMPASAPPRQPSASSSMSSSSPSASA